MTKTQYDKIPGYVKTTILVFMFAGSLAGTWYGLVATVAENNRTQMAAITEVQASLEKQIISCSAKHAATQASQHARDDKLHEEIVRIDERGSKQLQDYMGTVGTLESDLKHMNDMLKELKTGQKRIEDHLLGSLTP